MKRHYLLDPTFLIPIIGLSSLSLSIIGSISPHLFVNQLIFFMLGIVLYIFTSELDYRIYRRLSRPFYIISLLLLLAVFLGPSVRGATRWIDILGFRLQSSEILKPFIFIVFAHLLTSKNAVKIKNIAFIFLLFLPIIFLIFRQPDLGNALVYLGVFIFLLINSQINLIYIIASLLITLLFIPTIWNILKDYQKARIISFLNPHADPTGTGYNALQAIIAIGAGGFWGLGLGRGTQSHLLFLPEHHTDFIFASLVEEIGFLGGIMVLIFYSLLLFKILYTSYRTPDPFAKLICISVFSMMLIQIFVNIGMNLGILPITGITLPLVSYGGSSILSIFISLGLVQSVAASQRKHL
ncbi:rod shape-determining protein RodA [Candidatus Gottesmanbacteria bacterium]|nr:rod shape-determining protein RodA [Candidatus Gottesmanbacteria bacterium]